MPGANFRRLANVWRQATTDMSVAPFQAVKKAMVSGISLSRGSQTNMIKLDAFKAEGTATPSFTAASLEQMLYMTNNSADEEDIIRGAGSSAYAAGSDTVNPIEL
jgi:hypothetical protein